MRKGCRVLIVGAGITGLTVARELVARGVDGILILEKEPRLGAHASGRNSGVLHAGVYYTPETHKARFCADGNRLMKEFCRRKGLTLKESGKVIVAKTPAEAGVLVELKERAEACGADAVLIDERSLAGIEPHARTCGSALRVRDTAVIRPLEILDALARDVVSSGKAEIAYETAFEGVEGTSLVRTSGGTIRFGLIVNAAGAYADRVAHLFGLAHEYRILPFKGTYKELVPERRNLVRGNIYPVPDLRNPFLGVHFTRSADDHVYVGPTAIPALGRENYRLLQGVGSETARILWRDAVLLLRNSGFRSAALTEPRKAFRRTLHAEARALVPDLRLEDLEDCPKVGIRPQLVHWPSKSLVMDFVVISDGPAVHVLNAISPAFTSSMAFARHVVDVLAS